MNVLVDTSIWSLALRRKAQDLSVAESSAVSELNNLIQEGRAKIIGLVRQELLSGIKTTSQFEKLRDVLRSFPDEVALTSDYEFAASASNECRSKGVAVSVSDLLICAVAITRDWSIFSADPDCKSYAKILPLKLHTIRK